MANTCNICDKGAISGNNISHSTRHTKRTWNPNIKKVKAIVNGTPKRISVCTRCLR
ncbi:MAG TPA: 50S ribosomal protein L28, partial [Eubacteriaceae bacterium]|nr:50S ribosomal protein L28 [Eubacteriaceae bacterium]